MDITKGLVQKDLWVVLLDNCFLFGHFVFLVGLSFVYDCSFVEDILNLFESQLNG